MLARSFVSLALAASIFASVAPAAAKEGFFLGIGVGGAVVSGSDDVELETVSTSGNAILGAGCNRNPACVTTEYGSGAALLFHLGYNILGMISIELALSGFANNLGDSDKTEWQAFAQGNALIHPIGILEFAGVVSGLEMWDPYLIIGGGGTWGGYVAEIDGDDKGWFGPSLQTGAGLNIHVLSMLSVGVDLRMLFPFYEEWIWNQDDGIRFESKETEKPFIFQPTATITLHI
jgi:hypothetical protein